MKKDKHHISKWKGGKIILDAIKKNVKVNKNHKFAVWRPKKLEIIDFLNN